MGTLGTYLREAREAKGLDLREAAQQTRISINYLKAIESEDFSKLPGEVFVKGFLKNYARFLGLSESDVIRRYGEMRSPAPQEQAPAAARAETAPAAVEPAAKRYDSGPQRKRIELYLWGGLVLIALIAAVFMVLPGVGRQEKEGGAGLSEVTPTAQVAGGPTGTVVPEKLFLDIEAVEDTWVLVRTDASPQKHATLRKGEVVTYSADERFLLSFGGIGSVVLRLNGNELHVAGTKGAVVRDLMITSAGIVTHMAEVPRAVRKRPKHSPAAAPATAVSPSPPKPKPNPNPKPKSSAAATPSVPVLETAPAVTAPASVPAVGAATAGTPTSASPPVPEEGTQIQE